VAAPENTDLARQVLAALSHGDVPGLAALFHPDIEVHTARGVYRGMDAATEWARKRYEHLERQFVIDGFEGHGDEVVARVRTQYVWRESGLVGDEEPMTIRLRFADGKLVRWEYGESH
jgi:ketosteroid isomerase-like protein